MMILLLINLVAVLVLPALLVQQVPLVPVVERQVLRGLLARLGLQAQQDPQAQADQQVLQDLRAQMASMRMKWLWHPVLRVVRPRGWHRWSGPLGLLGRRALRAERAHRGPRDPQALLAQLARRAAREPAGPRVQPGVRVR